MPIEITWMTSCDWIGTCIQFGPCIFMKFSLKTFVQMIMPKISAFMYFIMFLWGHWMKILIFKLFFRWWWAFSLHQILFRSLGGYCKGRFQRERLDFFNWFWCFPTKFKWFVIWLEGREESWGKPVWVWFMDEKDQTCLTGWFFFEVKLNLRKICPWKIQPKLIHSFSSLWWGYFTKWVRFRWGLYWYLLNLNLFEWDCFC